MRTPHAILSVVALATLAAPSLAGPVVFSNYNHFLTNDGGIAQASAVTGANAPIVSPFVSNTASMQVVLDADASVRTVRVLASPVFLADATPRRPSTGLGSDPSADLDPRHQPSSASDPSSLAPLRVSIYASASDVVARTALASVDFAAGDYTVNAWGANSTLTDLTFDLGATLDLAAGDWFIEVAQVDPVDAQFFLTLTSGIGLHHFNPNTLALENSSFEFGVELGGAPAIPLPTAGALGLTGLALLGARRRR